MSMFCRLTYMTLLVGISRIHASILQTWTIGLRIGENEMLDSGPKVKGVKA